LTLKQGIVWVEHFSKRQNGEPLVSQFGFQQTLAYKPPSVLSTAIRPCITMKYHGQTVYILKFASPVARSEAVSGIPYKPRAWNWLRHIKGVDEAPENRLKLPILGCINSSPLILPNKKAAWSKLFGDLWDQVSTLITDLIDSVNNAERLAPYLVS
jgi:hypothetical protein